MDASASSDVKGLSPLLVGTTIGWSAALPMYLWQPTIQVAIASFVIAGYSAYLWTRAHNYTVLNGIRNGELRSVAVNAWPNRITRMMLDLAFWWTVLFGGAVVTGSVYWAGVDEVVSLVGVGAAWLMIASSLSYGLTLVHPSARCRRCGYDLAAQIGGGEEVVRCSECGARWSRAQLGLTRSRADWRHAA